MKRLLMLGVLMLAGKCWAQDIEVIKYPQLEQLIQSKENKVQIFNFWATWCKPCVEELPFLEAAHATYQSQGVQIYLISFDFVEQLDSRVKRYVDMKGIESAVKLLDETDYNSFIDKIDPSWSGAIPATLIVDNTTGERQFYEKPFKEGEISSIIEELIN